MYLADQNNNDHSNSYVYILNYVCAFSGYVLTYSQLRTFLHMYSHTTNKMHSLAHIATCKTLASIYTLSVLLINVTVHAKTSLVCTKIEIHFFTPSL